MTDSTVRGGAAFEVFPPGVTVNRHLALVSR